jgi:hypothetical protein
VKALCCALCAVLVGVLVAAPARARSLKDNLPAAARLVGIEGGSAFDALGDAIADTAARTLPVVAASAGFTYRYDAALEAFERTSDTLGPLFLERPDTIGRGKVNVNVSFQYVELDEMDGVATSELQASDPIVVRHPDRVTANHLRYSFQLLNYIVGLSATYGVLDNLDVNLLLPLINTNYDVAAYSQRQFVAAADGTFQPDAGPLHRGQVTGNAFGVGDILLRGKYLLPRYASWRSAAGLQLRLPTGAEGNLQGTGDFEVSPFLYGSTVLWSRVEPHVNLGLDLRTDDVGESQARYGVGVDVDVTKRLGVALAFLGRSQFARSEPAGATSFLHLTPSGPAAEPLLGIDFDRKDYFDFSFGARAVVWRQLMVFANGIYALNDDGLRSSAVIPMVGVEGTF